MFKYIINIALILTGCISKSQDCKPDLTKCNLVWTQIHENQGQINDLICDYYYYEQVQENFTKENFIRFLSTSANDSLLTDLLNQIDFRLSVNENFILCYTNLSMLSCAEKLDYCTDSVLSEEIVLFKEPVENCKNKYSNNQVEIYPFSKNTYKHDEFIQHIKFSVLKYNFMGRLIDSEKLFLPTEIKNHQKIRKTVLSISKNEDNNWDCEIKESEHNKDEIKFGEKMILDYLNTSEDAKKSFIDSMIIVLKFYEKDQSKI